MKKLLVLATFGLVLGLAQMSFATTFSDVPSGHWAEDAVQRLADIGIIEGYPEGDFRGDKPMSRYEYAMVVDRMMDLIENEYCTKDECEGGGDVTSAELEEAKEIVKKLAAEFKDELAALKVKVDENSARIDKIEEDVKKARIGNIEVSGSIRQRVDVPESDLSNAAFTAAYYNRMYDPNGAMAADGITFDTSNGFNAGYEMLPSLVFSGKAGDNVDFSIGLDKSIRTSNVGYDTAYEENSELAINHAYADIDFTPTVRELDLLKLKSGYQQFHFGPYGILVDNSGLTSNAAIRLDIAKDIVNFTGIAAMTNMSGVTEGLNAVNSDPYGVLRLGLDTRWIDMGLNFMPNGYFKEKGWGADVVAQLLTKTPFLNEFRAEYMTVTDLSDGSTPATAADDYSYIIGLDIYTSKRAGLTLSYADLPATVALSGLDANPFTEYDSYCPAGLDVAPVGGKCFSYESERTLFPAGFEGLGVEASYIVLGDVELATRGFIGNFAGGTAGGVYSDGDDYPGFAAVSVAKPINDKSRVRFEYATHGVDTVLLHRVRGELVITF